MIKIWNATYGKNVEYHVFVYLRTNSAFSRDKEIWRHRDTYIEDRCQYPCILTVRDTIARKDMEDTYKGK